MSLAVQVPFPSKIQVKKCLLLNLSKNLQKTLICKSTSSESIRESLGDCSRSFWLAASIIGANVHRLRANDKLDLEV